MNDPIELRMIALEARLASLEARQASADTGIGVDPAYLYTVPEAAIRMRCGNTNVYDLLESGQLAVTKVGNSSRGLRVRGSDIIAFMDSRKEGGPRPGKYKYLADYL